MKSQIKIVEKGIDDQVIRLEVVRRARESIKLGQQIIGFNEQIIALVDEVHGNAHEICRLMEYGDEPERAA